MPRDPDAVDDELVALVGEASHAPESEVRAALTALSPAEEKTLRRALRKADHDLSPWGWADLGRGLALNIVQARELTGFYSLQAERDALAAMVRGRAARQEQLPSARALRPNAAPGAARPASDQRAPEPPPQIRSSTPRAKERIWEDPGPVGKRARELLGLFAYHRDAPLVARALKLSLNELFDELDALHIRRRASRLARGVDADLPRATALPGAPTEAVRRRSRREEKAAPPPAPKSEREQQQEQLKALLAEVGPRRSELAARLGGDGARLAEPVLLARFRAAGLERELALRERDLLRALYLKHRGNEARVAAEMRATAAEVRAIAAERGLARELDAVRAGFQREARNKRWPKERILEVLDDEVGLRELGVYDELLSEVSARTQVIWKSLAGRKDALELLARKLHLERRDAVRLQRLLDLR